MRHVSRLRLARRSFADARPSCCSARTQPLFLPLSRYLEFIEKVFPDMDSDLLLDWSGGKQASCRGEPAQEDGSFRKAADSQDGIFKGAQHGSASRPMKIAPASCDRAVGSERPIASERALLSGSVGGEQDGAAGDEEAARRERFRDTASLASKALQREGSKAHNDARLLRLETAMAGLAETCSRMEQQLAIHYQLLRSLQQGGQGGHDASPDVDDIQRELGLADVASTGM